MKYWVNVYDDGTHGAGWPSREMAASSGRPCLQIVYRVKVTLKAAA
jgi:hypothetical protein